MIFQHNKTWRGSPLLSSPPRHSCAPCRWITASIFLSENCHTMCWFLILFSEFQAKSCICHVCGVHLKRLHSCLHCVFFGCFTKKHIHEHAKSKRHNLGKAPLTGPAGHWEQPSPLMFRSLDLDLQFHSSESPLPLSKIICGFLVNSTGKKR